jgi:hypothetical protein
MQTKEVGVLDRGQRPSSKELITLEWIHPLAPATTHTFPRQLQQHRERFNPGDDDGGGKVKPEKADSQRRQDLDCRRSRAAVPDIIHFISF